MRHASSMIRLAFPVLRARAFADASRLFDNSITRSFGLNDPETIADSPDRGYLIIDKRRG
jgi:hypothetical protein